VSDGTVCSEAHAVVTVRENHYGSMGETFQLIGHVVELLRRDDDSPGEVAALTLEVVKLVRRKHSPDNRDHYRDGCGYWEGLWRARQARDTVPGLAALERLAELEQKLATLTPPPVPPVPDDYPCSRCGERFDFGDLDTAYRCPACLAGVGR